MKIESIEVKNYRSIKHETLQCDSLTVLIGRNGAGKSSFLHALDSFYDVARKVTDEDFHNKNIGEPIEMTVTYSDLTELVQTLFVLYLMDE